MKKDQQYQDSQPQNNIDHTLSGENRTGDMNRQLQISIEQNLDDLSLQNKDLIGNQQKKQNSEQKVQFKVNPYQSRQKNERKQEMENYSYSEQVFKQLYVNKYNLLKFKSLKSSQHENDDEDNTSQPKQINSNGIVSIYTLTIIFILICLSIANLSQNNKTHWPHVKALTNYFTIYVLGQDDLSIYDTGVDIDEPTIQLTNLEDIQDHFQSLCGFIGNYSQAGFVMFENQHFSNHYPQILEEDIVESVNVERYYKNGKFIKQTITFQQFQQLIQTIDLREYLLSLRVLYIQISLGNTKFINDFKLILDYEIYSHSMLIIDLSTKWQEKPLGNQVVRISNVLRILQQFCAAILLIMYFLEAQKLYYNMSIDKQFRKNSLYWCASLIFLNFATITSSTLSPMCSVLQLLPIFENHDSSNTLTYNFNVNLRYAAPLAFSAFIPIYIIVNGFIFYSMIMYPGEYFDDYITSFFSYFYNNYQYGIYEIFTQLKEKGNLAYFLYVILYFYMVLVGGNLVPALFCILIYRKMAQRELIRFIQIKLQQIACPQCLQQNYKKNTYQVQLNIKSPKSPYLKSGTTLQTPKQRSQNKLAKMSIEEEKNSLISSPILSLTNKHKKIKNLTIKLEEYFQESFKQKLSRQWLEKRLEKIQQINNKIKTLQMKNMLRR